MFTCDELVAEVKRLGTEYPNAIYRGDCNYADGMVENGPETEGCIFGQAIRNLDKDIFSKNVAHRGVHILAVCEDFNIDTSKYNNGSSSSDNKIRICQGRQDRGVTWGEAIKALE